MALPKNASELNDISTHIPLVEGEEDDQTELDILNELNASPEDVSWKFRVHRILGASKDGLKEPFLFEGDGSIMEGLHERLSAQYGTGKYRVRIQRNNRLWKRLDIEVLAPAKPYVPPERQSEMSTVLAAIERLIERMSQPQQIVQSPPPVAVNPFDGIQQIATVMVSLKDLMGPKTDPTMSTMDAILKGVELAKSVSENGAGGGETNWMDLVKSFIQSPMAAQMAEQQKVANEGNKTNLPSSRLSFPATQPINPQVKPAINPKPNGETEMQQQIRGSILYLCQVASRGANPELYAEWVLDNWPRDMVGGILNVPNAMSILVQFAPEANSFVPWFQKLLEELKIILRDETGTGNPTHAPSPVSPIQPDGNSGWGGGDQDDIEANE